MVVDITRKMIFNYSSSSSSSSGRHVSCAVGVRDTLMVMNTWSGSESIALPVTTFRLAVGYTSTFSVIEPVARC